MAAEKKQLAEMGATEREQWVSFPNVALSYVAYKSQSILPDDVTPVMQS